MSISKVKASSTDWPTSSLTWKVELPEQLEGVDPGLLIKQSLAYNNAMYTLIGVTMDKLGVEFTKLCLGSISDSDFDKCVCDCCDRITNG
jgi:hypothetical protein